MKWVIVQQYHDNTNFLYGPFATAEAAEAYVDELKAEVEDTGGREVFYDVMELLTPVTSDH